MTQLIERSDPRYFSQTSDAPYDRHHYKIYFHGGETKVVESWEQVQEIWWNTISQFISHVDVLDIPNNNNNNKSNGGFKQSW